MTDQNADRYAEAGVSAAGAEKSLKALLSWITRSFQLRQGVGAVKLPIKYFANVIDLGGGQGLAITADGVGTKILIAEMMEKYDTVGIDCVAMNVNDLLCVGAEPISLVDYVAVEEARVDLLERIAAGLYEGARQARVTIPGGEIAQVKEMIRGVRPGSGFDLAAMAVGTVPLDKIIIGQDIEAGDELIGLRSSGIHSNGMTLARQVFFTQHSYKVDDYVTELGRKLGEELLEPTRIYVAAALDMLRSGARVKALAHITGDGFLNLVRTEKEAGFIIEHLPEPQPIFSLIQRLGQLPDEEMFRVYNMGIGFCLVVSPGDAPTIMSLAQQHGIEAYRLGCTVLDPERKVIIEPRSLVGQGDRFFRM
ncbi:MAG: phosphoribosylformylglycinamidine cyclo-ligase [Chloroflexota bacterium]|nr:MAG: phosphoribosylformylglycinamidine cyclo-ligase [Chloroflexota bacterium]